MIYKKFCKKYILILIATFFCDNFYSQTNSQIELPDVTTVVDSKTLEAESDSLPDFNDILEKSENSGSVTVELPDIDSDESEIQENSEIQDTEKNVFVEGSAFGGFPNLFVSDFSLFSETDFSPLNVHFNYKNESGFSKNSLNSGFFDSDAIFEISKTITKNNFVWNLNGFYNFFQNGLQNTTKNIYSVNQSDIYGQINFLWNITNHNHLGFDFSTSDYVRYVNITNNGENIEVEDFIKKSNYFFLSPKIFYYWKNSNFRIGIDANYDLDFYKKAYSRAETNADFSWQNDFLKVFSSVGFVIGTNVNSLFTVPFLVGINSSIPVSFSNRKIGLTLEGGLISQKLNLSEFEKFYKFTAFSEFPSETSNWFGRINFNLPIKNFFTANFGATYKQTAFNNGFYIPIYEDEYLKNGFYGYEQKNQKIFATSLGLSYFYKIFSISISWNANWLDVPVFAYAQQANVNFSTSNGDGKWGCDFNLSFLFNGDDKTPFICVNGFYKITDLAQIVVETSDLVKLISQKERVYVGQYKTNSGSATLGLKFNF